MASIHKNGNRPFYYVAYIDADGIKRFESTGIEHSPDDPSWTDEQRKEQIKLNALAADAFRGEIVRRTLSSDEPDQDSLENAKNRTNSILESCYPIKPITPAALLPVWAWTWSMEKKLAYARVNLICNAVDQFLAFLGPDAFKPLGKLKILQKVGAFELQLKSEKPAPTDATILSFRDVLDTGFRQAVKGGYLRSNPLAKLDRTDPVCAERLPFTSSEIEMILAAMNRWGGIGAQWHTALLLGVYTGLRMEDLFTLKRQNVNLAKGRLELQPGKNKKHGFDHQPALHPDLQARLERVLAALPEGEEYLLPDLAKRDSPSRNSSFKRLLELAEVEQTVVVREQGKRRFYPRTFHSLRHTVNQWLIESGVDREARKALLGHFGDDAHDAYIHEKHLLSRRAVQSLPSLLPRSAKGKVGDRPSRKKSVQKHKH